LNINKKQQEMGMKGRSVFRAVFVGVLVLLLAGCAANTPEEPQITIEEPWARAAAAIGMGSEGEMGGEGEMESGMDMQGRGATSAAYMIIKNGGRQADRLLEAQTDVASVVETHISEERDGVMVMSRVNGIEVPGQGAAELRPGGLHIMMIDLTQDLNPGDTINLTLIFEKSGPIQVSVPVREP
jgi:copper(I)-binding protein